jgi:tyrosyl-tRNA synthetase
MTDINSLLSRRVEKVLPEKDALIKMMGEKKLKLYLGMDPTATRLHLGHTIPLRKLVEFANAGHDATLLFGTGTVLVGDPSERDTGRKIITQEEIDKNIETWKEQVSPLVNWDKIKIQKNGDWLTKLTLKEIIKIASNISAVQLFKRDSFQRRIDKGDTVWYHETMYPLFQGYDSVVMDVDLEIGGTDQEFNMLIGRELQKKMKNRDKFVLTTPMIMGTDGKQMSKTSGNCVWLDDPPNDLFGKVMSIPDEQIIPYLELATNSPVELVDETKGKMSDGSLLPIDAKKKLAETVVAELHDRQSAKTALEHFENTYQKQNFSTSPSPSPAAESLVDTIAQITEVGSKSKAKRLIIGGAVKVNGETIYDLDYSISGGEQIKVGKKIFVRIE